MGFTRGEPKHAFCFRPAPPCPFFLSPEQDIEETSTEDVELASTKFPVSARPCQRGIAEQPPRGLAYDEGRGSGVLVPPGGPTGIMPRHSTHEGQRRRSSEVMGSADEGVSVPESVQGAGRPSLWPSHHGASAGERNNEFKSNIKMKRTTRFRSNLQADKGEGNQLKQERGNERRRKK